MVTCPPKVESCRKRIKRSWQSLAQGQVCRVNYKYYDCYAPVNFISINAPPPFTFWTSKVAVTPGSPQRLWHSQRHPATRGLKGFVLGLETGARVPCGSRFAFTSTVFLPAARVQGSRWQLAFPGNAQQGLERCQEESICLDLFYSLQGRAEVGLYGSSLY